MDARKLATLANLELYWKFESTPFTQNMHYFSTKREEKLAMFQQERRKAVSIDAVIDAPTVADLILASNRRMRLIVSRFT